MNTAMLPTRLASWTTVVALTGPAVVFGFLYLLQVRPERAAAADVRARLEAARAELTRQRISIRTRPILVQASALEEFDARTVDGGEAGDIADALVAVLNSPSIGGVLNLSIETGAAGSGPRDSMMRVFARPVVHTPVTATFDARYEQIGRFFWNLRVLPTIFDLQSLELGPAPGPQGRQPGRLMRAKVSLLAFHRPRGAMGAAESKPQPVDVITPPMWVQDPFARGARSAGALAQSATATMQPEHVVSSILISGGRSVARIDGRVVHRGDRVRGGVVHAIDADAVTIVAENGRVRRVRLERPPVHLARQSSCANEARISGQMYRLSAKTC